MNTILDLLISYFKGGGIGLNEKEINCEEYLALKEFIDLFHLDTPTLIGAYFKEKATEQFVSCLVLILSMIIAKGREFHSNFTNLMFLATTSSKIRNS